MKRFGAVAVSSALLLGGGSGLLAAALSGVPAGADTTLGGFTVNALAEACEAVRFSLGTTTTAHEIHEVLRGLPAIIDRARQHR